VYEEHVTLGTREQRRAVVLTRVVVGDWTPAQAALALRLSVRQAWRLAAAYRVRRAAGVSSSLGETGPRVDA
jgi:hypothetical protein